MKAELFASLILGIIGFFAGGVVGLGMTETWSPYCWYGLIIGAALPLGVCLCGLFD